MPGPDPASSEVIEALRETRERTLALVRGVSHEDLERVHSPLMSPLVWDLGHIAAFEDLWLVHRYADRPLRRPELMNIYDALESPRAKRGQLKFLRTAEALGYMDEVRRRALEVLEQRGAGDGLTHELVIRHEQQHGETMLQTLQLAGLPGYRLLCAADGDANGASHEATLSGLEFVEIPEGPCMLGAEERGFAYDNERPRHRTDVRGYRIARTPVTNATYLTFVEGGGYERREWWTDEGWAWKEEYDITRPGAWTQDLDGEWRLGELHTLDPSRPVVHISWFEADALARSHQARLPTEAEWEKAATWDQEHQLARTHPRGEERFQPGVHGNFDQIAPGPQPVGEYPDGASAYGCLGMIGDVWEWTSTCFSGYPGFTAHPYREYSEVFFGNRYRVLRGGSWATRARVIGPTFRNWDLPSRRQIFAGVRLAIDL